MAITQVISSIAPAATPSMGRELFSTTAAQNVVDIVDMVPELNTWAGQVNAIVSGTAGDIASGINGAAAKTTPVDADLLTLTDSAASWVLKKFSWANLKTTLGSTFAAIAGSASQAFYVGAATAAGHAVRLDQLAGAFPAIASAGTIDIFAIAGAAVSISGTTTVTAITACTADQVGSIKTLIPSNAAGFSITATANIVIDGNTSGTYLMPLNANIQIIATSTTTFKITTIYSISTIVLTLTAATTPPTTPITTTATINKQSCRVFIDFRFVNVNTTGAVGLLQVSGLPVARSSAVGVVGMAGFGAAACDLHLSEGAGTASLLDKTTLDNINITAGTGKYLYGTISYDY